MKNRCLENIRRKSKKQIQIITDIDEHDEEEEVDKRGDVKRLELPRTKKKKFIQ